MLSYRRIKNLPITSKSYQFKVPTKWNMLSENLPCCTLLVEFFITDYKNIKTNTNCCKTNTFWTERWSVITKNKNKNIFHFFIRIEIIDRLDE